MILEVVQSKWSLTWYDPLGPRMCVLELMNGHVLQTLREQLKVPGSRLEGSELLTSEFLRFRSRLNETSGGLGKQHQFSGLGFNVNADGKPDVRPKFCFISFEKYRLGLNSSPSSSNTAISSSRSTNIIFCLSKNFSVLNLEKLVFGYRSWKRF